MGTAHHGKQFFGGLRAAALALALALVMTGCGAKPVEVDPTPLPDGGVRRHERRGHRQLDF